MGKGKGTGSGRPKTEKPKRVSGTGYTKSEAAQLKYSKQADDGTYEIDIDKITEIVNAYIEPEFKTRTVKAGSQFKEIEYRVPISEPGLMDALHIYDRETFNLWASGHVNRAHKDNEEYRANIQLSDSIRAGVNAIARYIMEDEESSKSSISIRQLETMGYIGPAQSRAEVNASISLGKYRKYSK